MFVLRESWATTSQRHQRGLACVSQALTLGREVAQVYAEAITLLQRLDSTPVDPAHPRGPGCCRDVPPQSGLSP